HVETAFCELNAVDADPTANLEQPALAAGELGEKVAQVVVRRVSTLLDLPEVFVGRAGRVGVVLVVDVRLPEVLDRRNAGIGFGLHPLSTFPLRKWIVLNGATPPWTPASR